MPTNHEVEIALLKAEVYGLNAKMDSLQSDVRELVDAWKAAGALVGFVKTAAAFVLALGVLIGAVRYGITGDGK